VLCRRDEFVNGNSNEKRHRSLSPIRQESPDRHPSPVKGRQHTPRLPSPRKEAALSPTPQPFYNNFVTESYDDRGTISYPIPNPSYEDSSLQHQNQYDSQRLPPPAQTYTVRAPYHTFASNLPDQPKYRYNEGPAFHDSNSPVSDLYNSSYKSQYLSPEQQKHLNMQLLDQSKHRYFFVAVSSCWLRVDSRVCLRFNNGG